MNVEVQNQKKLSLPILQLITTFRQQNGLNHQNFYHYRSFCKNRLVRLRKSTKLTNLNNNKRKKRKENKTEKEKFTKKWVTNETLTDEKVMQLPILEAERSWATAMAGKCSIDEISGKKNHGNKMHLVRASIHAKNFDELVKNSDICDATTKLEAHAYSSWLMGISCIEHKKWNQAADAFKIVVLIYEALAEATDDASLAKLFQNKCSEVKPQIRLCEFNATSSEEMSELLVAKLQLEKDETLDKLIDEVRQKKIERMVKKAEELIKTDVLPLPKINSLPKFEPMPNKPLFFDLTEKYIGMPLKKELETRLNNEEEDKAEEKLTDDSPGIVQKIKGWFYRGG